VLPGPGKAGTTSLFWYLAQHPEICRSSIKETLYFVPLSETEQDADGRLPPLSDYRGYFRRYAHEEYAMEASPRYFHGGPRLVAALGQTLPGVRVLVTLRDPVARTWSVFRYARSMRLIPKSLAFADYLDRCDAVTASGALQTDANRPYWSISAGRYADHLPAWLEHIPAQNLRIVFFEHLVADVPRTLEGLCHWLAIDPRPVCRFDLTARNRSNDYRLDGLHRVALAANHERLLRNHPRLKRPLRAFYYAVNRDRSEPSMPEPARRRLERTFSESTQRLHTQLIVHGCTDLPGWLTASTLAR